ncbi:dna repair protein rad4 domain-containing protein [Cystoisospora suis]|uniref:Dna repair protein rad4 domain-containing protein n=1 Tax=Cystoisospora suis TaxID=483139 RepID=A0A2C6JYY8_9APIC|nr:dna repair protein rad4 domain-containing protein [Cystoisospora suis]
MPIPRVENGRLPQNRYGNIEVGKLGPVPIGAVHISLTDFICSSSSSSSLSHDRQTSLSASSSSRRDRSMSREANTEGGRKKPIMTCLSEASLGRSLVTAAMNCGVEYKPAIVGFDLYDDRREDQTGGGGRRMMFGSHRTSSYSSSSFSSPYIRRGGAGGGGGGSGWIVKRDGIVVLQEDEERVREAWAIERQKREVVCMKRREKKEMKEREDSIRKWRVLCRAILFWREREEEEDQKKEKQRIERDHQAGFEDQHTAAHPDSSIEIV